MNYSVLDWRKISYSETLAKTNIDYMLREIIKLNEKEKRIVIPIGKRFRKY